MAQRDVFFVVCSILRYTAAFGSLCCAIVFMFLLRIYGVVFSLLCMGAEIEISSIMQAAELLKFWISRGMLQIFVAILTSAVGAHWSTAIGEKIFYYFSFWLLLVCGFIYSIAGLIGFGEIRKKLIVEEQSEAVGRREVQMPHA